jgi:cytochrome c nitrite reductase small subunit
METTPKSSTPLERIRRRLPLGWSLAGIALSVLIGAALGAGGYTVNYAEGTSYLSSDPTACVNCHIMRDKYDGCQKASHHAVATCNDCHVPHDFIPKYLVKAENGFWHSKGFTLQDFHEPIQLRTVSSRILNTNCLKCHESLVGDVLGHAAADERATLCTHCHASVGHGPSR